MSCRPDARLHEQVQDLCEEPEEQRLALVQVCTGQVCCFASQEEQQNDCLRKLQHVYREGTNIMQSMLQAVLRLHRAGHTQDAEKLEALTEHLQRCVRPVNCRNRKIFTSLPFGAIYGSMCVTSQKLYHASAWKPTLAGLRCAGQL